MTLNPLNTNPILQAHFALRMDNSGQLLVNEDVAHLLQNSSQAMSECCRQETYQMDGKTMCGYCYNQCSAY